MSAKPGPTVCLPRSLVDAMVGHAREARPNESCGLVVGSGSVGEGGVAVRYVPCRNAAASPSRYLVHRDDLLAVFMELDRTGEELWGVVHSHVRTAAVPSSTDVGEATWPAAVYLLVSLEAEPPSVRAWRIVGGAAEELALEIRDDLGDNLREAAR